MSAPVLAVFVAHPEHAGRVALRALPALVTLVGAGLGAWGVALGVVDGWPLLLASALADGVDGRLARWLGCTSRWGSALDWHVDVLLAHALPWRVLPVPLAALASVVLLGLQAHWSTNGLRASGRLGTWALLCVGTLAAWALRWVS